MSVVWEPVVDTVRRLMSPPPDAQFGSHPYTILASIAVCAGTLLFLQNTRLLLPRRVQLKKSDELEWNLRVVSTLHAITLVIGNLFCPQHTELRSSMWHVIQPLHGPESS